MKETHFPPLTIETTVKILIYFVNRGKIGANHINGILFSITYVRFFKIGNKNKILTLIYARNQIFELLFCGTIN